MGVSYSRAVELVFSTRDHRPTPTHSHIMSEEGRVSNRQVDSEPGSIEIIA